MTINNIPYYNKQIKYNKTALKRNESDIKAIVIHYTGNSTKGANAEAHFNYFNLADRQSSADVFIDDNSIWKVNDWFNYYSWAIGDGKSKYGWNNRNTISIEMCINSDGDFSKTQENAINYIRFLHKNGYTKTLIRHYDASRKLCPIMYVDLNIAGYNEAYTYFRKAVFENKPVITKTDEPEYLYKVQVGAFKELKNAQYMADKLKDKGIEALIIKEKI